MVEGAALEMPYTPKAYRGFESHTLRFDIASYAATKLSSVSFGHFQDALPTPGRHPVHGKVAVSRRTPRHPELSHRPEFQLCTGSPGYQESIGNSLKRRRSSSNRLTARSKEPVVFVNTKE